MTVEKEDIHKAFWWLEHQRIFFFGAFVIGSLIILSMKVIGVYGGFVSASAVSVMLAYAYLGVRQKLTVRIDVVGDNVYYLGFLFTLISLSYSLYQLGAHKADIDNLLENFGLAIATTLVGLALRVFFNQPKADIYEYETAVRMSLTEATANFVGETSKISRDISTLRSVLNQVIEETSASQKNATEMLNTNVNEQIALLGSTSKKNQRNIEKLLQKIEDVQDKFSRNLEINADALNNSISDSVGKITQSADAFSRNFDLISASVDELNKTVTTVNGLLSNWDGMVDKIFSNNTSASEKLNHTVEMIQVAHDVHAKIFDDISGRFNLLTEEVKGGVGAAGATLNSGLEDIKISISSLNSQLSNSNTLLVNFSEATKDLDTRLKGFDLSLINYEDFKASINDSIRASLNATEISKNA